MKFYWPHSVESSPMSDLNSFESRTRRAERNDKLMAYAHKTARSHNRAEGIARVTLVEPASKPKPFLKAVYEPAE